MKYITIIVIFLISFSASALTPVQQQHYDNLKNRLLQPLPDDKMPRFVAELELCNALDAAGLDVLYHIEKHDNGFNNNLLLTAMIQGRYAEFDRMCMHLNLDGLRDLNDFGKRYAQVVGTTTALGAAEEIDVHWKDLLEKASKASAEYQSLVGQRKKNIHQCLNRLYCDFSRQPELLDLSNLIWWATYFEHVTLVKELCKQGVKLNTPDARGSTALDVALSTASRQPIAQALIDAGADLLSSTFLNYVITNGTYTRGWQLFNNIKKIKPSHYGDIFSSARWFLTKYLGSTGFESELSPEAFLCFEKMLAVIPEIYLDKLKNKINDISFMPDKYNKLKKQIWTAKQQRIIDMFNQIYKDRYGIIQMQENDDDDNNDIIHQSMVANVDEPQYARPVEVLETCRVYDPNWIEAHQNSIKALQEHYEITINNDCITCKYSSECPVPIPSQHMKKFMDKVNSPAGFHELTMQNEHKTYNTLINVIKVHSHEIEFKHTKYEPHCVQGCLIRTAYTRLIEQALQTGIKELIEKRVLLNVPTEMGDGPFFAEKLSALVDYIYRTTGIRIHTLSDEDIAEIRAKRPTKALPEVDMNVFDQLYINPINELDKFRTMFNWLVFKYALLQANNHNEHDEIRNRFREFDWGLKMWD